MKIFSVISMKPLIHSTHPSHPTILIHSTHPSQPTILKEFFMISSTFISFKPLFFISILDVGDDGWGCCGFQWEREEGVDVSHSKYILHQINDV